MNEEDRILDETDVCFVTGHMIENGDRARWTDELDAWISESGQAIVEREATTDYPHSSESLIIYGDWYAKDEANSANEEYRIWHK